jgi:hypothetical protein
MLKRIAKAYSRTMQWRTARKIVVFESDDWGSVRMPDMQAYNKLVKEIPSLEEDYYARLDTIAGVDDLISLYEILLKYKDSRGNHPVITANSIMANPDYKKIKESAFTEYHYEPFYKTILSLADGNAILKLWHEGMEKKIFHPQLHGREHVLVDVWMKELHAGNHDLRAAFNYGVFSVPVISQFYVNRKNLQAALDYSSLGNAEKFQENFILEGAAIFKDYFGFASRSFIAPSYVWNQKIEKVLKKAGVLYIQGLAVQYEPQKADGLYRKRLHYTGQKNKEGQVYLTRNVFFEPSYNPVLDWTGDCMKRIESAFESKSPAIVGVHRVNFIGSLDAANRQKNLAIFDTLLKSIVTKWPDVEFMTSDELGDVITKKQRTEVYKH